MQNRIPAAISLRATGGALIPYEADGFIPNLRQFDRVRLLVRPYAQQSTCITVDSAKHLSAADFISTNSGPLFNRWIQVPAQYEENHLRLVNLNASGHLRVYEIAIVKQGRNFFLTSQLVYDEQCYLGTDGFAVVPKFSPGFVENPWPEFVTLVNDLVVNRLDFPDLHQYQPAPASVKSLSPNEARVEWYSIAKRLGIAKTSTVDQAIILASDVPQNGTHLRTLKSGDTVRFERMVPQDQGCPYRLQELTLVS